MTDERNPYAAPANPVVSAPATAADTDFSATVLAEPPHARPLGEGAAWVSEGWQLFKRQPVLLVALVLVVFILYVLGSVVLQLLPLIGSVFASMYGVVMLAGLTLAVDRLYRGEDLSFEFLFAGFRHPARTSLALLGAGIAVVSLLLNMLAAWLSGAWPFLMAAYGIGDATPESLWQSGVVTLETMLLYVLLVLLFMTPLMVASWFSMALVMFNELSPWQACVYSFRAVLRNLLPLMVQSLLFMLLGLASVFTLFLGLLVLVPLFVTSWYISYRRVCTDFVPVVKA